LYICKPPYTIYGSFAFRTSIVYHITHTKSNGLSSF
jgi:hypothetical protein